MDTDKVIQDLNRHFDVPLSECFTLIFYQSAEDAVFKALDVE